MQRCLDLAKKGAGNVSPNPMVGCVIVYQNRIVGEGFHEKHGGQHAEANAIKSVDNQQVLHNSTLYVSLEPCTHFGLTPPCSNLIIEKRIPRVVIGTIDPFAAVAGKGIERMKKAEIEVSVGVLESECRNLNKRFFTFHEKKRPFIILKWAQTVDGFIDVARTAEKYGQPNWITEEKALKRVHRMRAEEDAILVGTVTALKDNPRLTARSVKGKNPLRIVLDNRLRLPENLHVFDGSVPTLVFNSLKNERKGNLEFIKINFDKNAAKQVINELYNKKILSVIVEGGQKTLASFINAGLWDEAHVFTSEKKFGSGVAAPELPGQQPCYTETIGKDKLFIFKNSV
ncbi:MAG: riboflavin biosynthesis protein RibD [Draconibacterium sp.]|nr:MAG: riboflavin biosynthesis protein RibD [Draconibacterium sp.]